jgi:hypothetical protein
VRETDKPGVRKDAGLFFLNGLKDAFGAFSERASPRVAHATKRRGFWWRKAGLLRARSLIASEQAQA